MSIIRVGATKKYSDGWEAAFAKGKKKGATTAKKSAAKQAAPKKSAKKKPAKKKK